MINCPSKNISQSLDMNFTSIKNMKWKFDKSSKSIYFQIRESLNFFMFKEGPQTFLFSRKGPLRISVCTDGNGDQQSEGHNLQLSISDLHARATIGLGIKRLGGDDTLPCEL